MSIGELNLARPWGRIGGTIGLLLLTSLLLRCGSDDKKKDDPIPNPTPEIPADWDGNSDWNGSLWKVTTE